MSVDTICGMVRSVCGYRNVMRYACQLTDYAGLWMDATKSFSSNMIHYVKLVLNTTGRHPAMIKTDNGEFLTTSLQTYCDANGIDTVVGAPNKAGGKAGAKGNMPVERGHRTCHEMSRALMNWGGVGPHMWEPIRMQTTPSR